MLTVTSAQLDAWLGAFVWPFVRFLALISTAPVLSHRSLPTRVKIALAAGAAMLIAPTLPPPPAIAVGSGAGLWLLVQQLMIGAAIGFAMRVVTATVTAAGDYAGMQMGLSFAQLISPGADSASTALARLLEMFALLIFLSLDGHLRLLGTLADSFRTLPLDPAAAPMFNAGAWRLLADWGASVFWAGLMLALPVVAALLIANLALGILNRAAPQVGVFQVGFAITLLVGLLMLDLMLPSAGPFVAGLFDNGFGMAERVLGAMAR
ncbi:flagellar biosynthetic protein FliR [Chitinasiproducens palmae]|uniref:Flagellar biosynthetic protein FliR n=1 Tax=Chitinasiproducens palmae TaxID=1770053 RepID=A0A1H2PJR3_9BURK|nr:flagellar biosynthetic protein FliR [Chitinasiproducens palmae]SDV46595.1 flagellar biosynthetic protein FliR [Chitinasiproducens palmae]